MKAVPTKNDMPLVQKGVVTDAVTIEPYKFYKFDALSSLSLILASTPSGLLPFYSGKFTVASDAEDFAFSAVKGSSYLSGQVVAFEPNCTYEFYVVDDILSFTKVDETGGSISSSYPIVTLSVGHGSMTSAQTQAASHPQAYFQWLLVAVDGNDNTIRKMIWHLPKEANDGTTNGLFIDALGSIIE